MPARLPNPAAVTFVGSSPCDSEAGWWAPHTGTQEGALSVEGSCCAGASEWGSRSAAAPVPQPAPCLLSICRQCSYPGLWYSPALSAAQACSDDQQQQQQFQDHTSSSGIARTEFAGVVLCCSFGVAQEDSDGALVAQRQMNRSKSPKRANVQRSQRIQLVTTDQNQKCCCSPTHPFNAAPLGQLPCCAVSRRSATCRLTVRHGPSSLSLHRDHHTPAQHNSSATAAMMQFAFCIMPPLPGLLPTHPPAAAVVPVFTQPDALQSSKSESKPAGMHQQGYQMLTGAGVQL